MAIIAKCPKHGADTLFYVTAHVSQEWKVDSNGMYVETVNECMDVTHAPDDGDLWSCHICHEEAEVTYG